MVAENEALEKALEMRFERMRHDGVEKEIKTFIETYPTAAKSNTGVAQAIGVREFLDETDDDTETRFEKMCARTKRLARRQRRQFANMVESSEFRSAPTIEIDATKMHELLAASPPSSSKADAFWEDEVVSSGTIHYGGVCRRRKRTIDKKSTRRDVIVDLEENNDAWIERARAKRAVIEFSAAIAIGWRTRHRKDTKIALKLEKESRGRAWEFTSEQNSSNITAPPCGGE